MDTFVKLYFRSETKDGRDGYYSVDIPITIHIKVDIADIWEVEILCPDGTWRHFNYDAIHRPRHF